jgi:acetyl-CoA decarbonylase/synthase complex subunit delta
MERARLAALSGDKTIASPFICFVAQEAWKAKEAKVSPEQGIIWEAVTATALIQAGADILVMRHPFAIEKVNEYIDNLWLEV